MQDQQNNQNQEVDDEFDDFDDLQLFHKSSLREEKNIPYPEISQEIYVDIKRDQQNRKHIGEYIELGQIGRGSFANVYKAEKLGTLYAIKSYNSSVLSRKKFYVSDGSYANAWEMFQNQINIIKRLDCPNLAKCIQILYAEKYVNVINELCDLGQIMHWNDEKNKYERNQQVTERIGQKYKTESFDDITRIIFLQIAKGVQYMHSRNITNRDIKIDNILCKTTENQGDDIKIADFTTVRYSEDDISFFVAGTPGFRGPQVQPIENEQDQNAGSGYSCKAGDIWSFGVCLYTFYYGQFPFMGETEYQIDTLATKKELNITPQSPDWLKGVLAGTTKKKWKERININQVIEILTK